MFPIFLPQQHHVTLPTCKHCGQVIRPDKDERRCARVEFSKMIASAVMLAVGFIWVIVTLLNWTKPYYGSPTLVQVVKDQIASVIALMHRIW